MMEVRLAESYPHARSQTDDSYDTQTDPWTRPKRHYNRPREACGVRQKKPLMVVRAGLQQADAGGRAGRAVLLPAALLAG